MQVQIEHKKRVKRLPLDILLNERKQSATKEVKYKARLNIILNQDKILK